MNYFVVILKDLDVFNFFFNYNITFFTKPLEKLNYKLTVLIQLIKLRKEVDKSCFKLRVYVTEINIDIRSSFLEPICSI